MAVDQMHADAHADLSAARAAWHDKAMAESQLSRLRAYRGSPTAGMRADINRWALVVTNATETLRRILGQKP